MKKGFLYAIVYAAVHGVCWIAGIVLGVIEYLAVYAVTKIYFRGIIILGAIGGCIGSMVISFLSIKKASSLSVSELSEMGFKPSIKGILVCSLVAELLFVSFLISSLINSIVEA